MALNILGVVGMVFFYLLVLGTGIWASFKSRKATAKSEGTRMEVALLGNRQINLVVGIFTTTASWIGGGFIIIISEMVYTPSMGLAWAIIMPLGASVAFIIIGLFFAKPMRDKRFITMMDPFQIKYGNVPTAILTVAALASEIIWVAISLIALGTTMSVILDLSYMVSVWVSAAVAIIYTLLGGLYSVAYTDVIQLILIFISLWLCVPFILMHPSSSDIITTAYNSTVQGSWLGTIETDHVFVWIDSFTVLCLGNLGYQGIHQRTLSASSSATAKLTCFLAAGAMAIFTIPSVLIGAAAASTDWNQTSYGSPSPLERGEAKMVMPICLQYLTPPYISLVGIGAIAAAAMSSTDSFMLSATSIFSANIYKNILRTQASEREMQWVIRVAVVVVGVAGSCLSMLKNSIILLWDLSMEVMYIHTMPQLVCVLFFNISNVYGSMIGLLLVLVLRLLCGMSSLGIPPVILFPGDTLEDGVHIQRFPVRTLCALCAVSFILLFSYLASLIFSKELIPEKWDVFKMKARQAAATARDENERDGNPELEKNAEQDVTQPMMDTRC